MKILRALEKTILRTPLLFYINYNLFTTKDIHIFFYTIVFNDLKTRGVKRVLIFSSDNLSRISQAIATTYQDAKIQKCVVHQIRNSMKYVNYKQKKC